MNELKAATSLQDINFIRATRLHSLSGKYKNCFAIDLIHPYRLVLKQEDGNKDDLKTITSVKIIEIANYH